jgi:6-phosphogluconolactonase
MNLECCRIARLALSIIVLIAFTACGGGSSPPPLVGAKATRGPGSGGTVPGSNTTYRVGGTVSGLVGQGLTIELLNPATSARHTTILEQIDIVANGVFVFRIPASQGYGVAIVHQPHAPTQRCVVRNGKGVIGAASVSDVGIVCSAHEVQSRLVSPASAVVSAPLSSPVYL